MERHTLRQSQIIELLPLQLKWQKVQQRIVLVWYKVWATMWDKVWDHVWAAVSDNIWGEHTLQCTIQCTPQLNYLIQQQCETKYEQQCSTIYEEVCEEAQPSYNSYGAPSTYGAPKQCKQVKSIWDLIILTFTISLIIGSKAKLSERAKARV